MALRVDECRKFSSFNELQKILRISALTQRLALKIFRKPHTNVSHPSHTSELFATFLFRVDLRMCEHRMHPKISKRVVTQ